MKCPALMTVVVSAVVLSGIACLAQSKNGGRPLNPLTGALEKMPKDLEVRFALSALPPHLRDAATVLVLDPASGYVLDRKGSNGFSCIVERTEWARAQFRNDIFTALCYDEEGSRNHLRVYLDAAAMRAKGMSADAVKQEIARRFANKTYVAPKRMGLSYMLAPLMRTYPNPDLADNTVLTMSMPHHMIYAPNLTDKDIGGAPPPSPYPFIFEQGPQGYMILLLGEKEKAKVLEGSKGLMADLCSYRDFLCLNDAPH
jgi:hypothetical protein